MTSSVRSSGYVSTEISRPTGLRCQTPISHTASTSGMSSQETSSSVRPASHAAVLIS